MHSPGHNVGSMLLPVARNCNVPVERRIAAAKLRLHSSWVRTFMERLLRFLVELTLLLDILDFSASQRQRFKHTLVSKLRLGIWLLAGTLGGWALVLARRLVHLSHRNPHMLWLVSCSLPRRSTG